MAERRSLTPISEAEYEAIEAAVMETARGRWFLTEFARRNRNADTTVLLDAISRLEQAVVGERSAHGVDRLRFDLMEMAKAIARTKSEIAAIRPNDQEPGPLASASEALDAIVRQTEQATSDILEAAEHVQEAAWTLREDGADAKLCDELDRRATQIYTACSFQDLTAQRMARIVQTLRYLEGRINAMIDIWGGEDEADQGQPDGAVGPRSDEKPSLDQDDIDLVIVETDLFGDLPGHVERQFALGAPTPGGSPLVDTTDDLAFIEEPVSPEPILIEGPTLTLAAQADPALPPAIRPEAFEEIDALDTREKLRRFT